MSCQPVAALAPTCICAGQAGPCTAEGIAGKTKPTSSIRSASTRRDVFVELRHCESIGTGYEQSFAFRWAQLQSAIVRRASSAPNQCNPCSPDRGCARTKWEGKNCLWAGRHGYAAGISSRSVRLLHAAQNHHVVRGKRMGLRRHLGAVRYLFLT